MEGERQNASITRKALADMDHLANSDTVPFNVLLPLFVAVNPPLQSPSQAAPLPKQENIKPEQVIYHDLKEVHMDWKLSCYGLNLDWTTGNNIIHGDYSPEEMRCEAYYQSRSFGNLNNYLALLARFMEENQNQRSVVLRDITGAIMKGRMARPVAHVPSAPGTAASSMTATVNPPSLGEFELGSIPEIL